ncbi:MAG TPA: Ig-like domain-containing protein [Kiritimatiellia bacterium]|nr:immunoglobulin domain-containing protein [Verrucomicrobiota bacterium]HPV47359.1 Ig-like domain-containing protein [Kiritimatiellia bacterium]
MARCITVALLLPALPVISQTLPEALDTTDILWSTWVTDTQEKVVTGTGGEWSGQTAVTHDGVDAARSGTLPTGHTAHLRTESLSGPGTVTFWRRHGLTNYVSPYLLQANDQWIYRDFPGGEWQPLAVELPPGPATLEFLWQNSDWAGQATDNFAYVDEVVVHEASGAPVFFPSWPSQLTAGEGYRLNFNVPVLGAKPMRIDAYPPDSSWSYYTQVPQLMANDAPRLSGYFSSPLAETNSAGTWTIVASNALGVVTNYITTVITSTPPHSIYIEGPYEVWAGAQVELVAQPSGTPPFTYQWEKDGAPLPGQVDATLVLPHFSAADEGVYAVVVSNALGATRSSEHWISLGDQPPMITSAPDDVNLSLYDYGYLEADFEGTPPFMITWRRDGQVVDEDPYTIYTGTFLSLYGRMVDTPGVYTVSITNGLGGVQSDPVVVQVGLGIDLAAALDNPTVGWRQESPYDVWWTSQSVVTHDGEDAAGFTDFAPGSLRTAVRGPATISFWWRAMDAELSFQVDGVEKELLEAVEDDSGWQKVVLQLDSGWHELEWLPGWEDWDYPNSQVYVDEFEIFVASKPEILQQPQGGDFTINDTAHLTIGVLGETPFRYQLYRGDTLLQTVSDVASSTYSFDVPIQNDSAGAYWIEVTDALGRSATSDDAIISVDDNFGVLDNFAAAVNQPDEDWYYTDWSWLSGDSYYPIRPWYRTYADGFPAGTAACGRTPVLQAGELAAVFMDYDAPTPMVLRFWLRLNGATPEEAFGLSLDGDLQNPIVIGTAPGTSGEIWTGYEIALGTGFTEIQWEILAPVDGVVAFLGNIEVLSVAPPEITQQPEPLVLVAGERGNLSVNVSGAGPFTYQWFKQGVGPLSGETAATLSFASAAAGDSGVYWVEVANPFGTTTSDTVTVTVTGPRPYFTQVLQPQQLLPGDNLSLEVAVVSANGPLTYRWYHDGTLVPSSGSTYSRTGVTTADAGLYRVEVSDPYYTITNETRVTVSPVLYTVTWLWASETNHSAGPEAINNSGVVVGDTDSGATVWTNGTPLRLTPSGTPFSQAYSINDQGDVVGIQYGPRWFEGPRTVQVWSPPYAPANFTNLGTPAGHPFIDIARLNNRGEIIATESAMGLFGQPRYSFRYTPAEGWSHLGPLTGTSPLPPAIDQGWATILDINNAGLIVGLSYFQEENFNPTQATGWRFDPTVRPLRRQAMDTLDPRLALTPAEPWGWLDVVNDLGDIIGRHWATNAPTKLYLIDANGITHKLLERPPVLFGIHDDGEGFNIDAMNNRREMVGYRRAEDGGHAILVRDRTVAPGVLPTTFNNFEMYDLEDLVIGGTGEFRLAYARGMNDAGQIVGSTRRDSGDGGAPGFLLTPVMAYPDQSAHALEDLITRTAGEPVEFSASSLLVNDLGVAPLAVVNVATSSDNGGTITDLGGGQYRYTPPAGPDQPDRFTYTLQAADSTTAEGTVRVLLAPAPLPPPDGSAVQVLPEDQVRIRFEDLPPGQTFRLEAAQDPEGPWVQLATFIVRPDGVVEYIEMPPLDANARFYRVVPVE